MQNNFGVLYIVLSKYQCFKLTESSLQTLRKWKNEPVAARYQEVGNFITKYTYT